MKIHLYFTLFVFLLVVLFLPCQQALAQVTQIKSDTTNTISGDTMWVAYQRTGTYNTIRPNALRSAIFGDTTATGARANLNRIYGLKNGGFYWEDDDISFSTFTLRLVGGSFADANFPTGRTMPPMFQMTDTRADGTTSALHLITASNNLTLKNIFVTGCSNVNGTQTAYQPITFPASNCTFIVDNCVFQRSNFSLIVVTGTGNTVSVTNCKFRNLLESPPTQQWTGRGVSIWADNQSVVMENNTFFNVAFATFQVEGGSAAYLRYNHNTIVNLGRCVMSGSGDWWQSAYFTNNLIINGYWEAEGYADMHGTGRDVRNIYDGLFHVATLPASYGTMQSRRVVIAKNWAYLDPTITAKYGVGGGKPDTITRAWFLDPASKADYVTPYLLSSGNGHIYVADTNWLTAMPAGMADYLHDVTWLQPQNPTISKASMTDSMYAMITQVRNGGINIAPYYGSIYTVFFYKPSVNNSDRVWPLPENFSYTDATLMKASTDGLPLGDLNWFPTQKATFVANQTSYVKAIEALAGQVVIDSVKSMVEAEAGGVSGTAAIQTNQGFIYWTYSNVGNLTWTFNAPTAGIYGTRWVVNLNGAGGSQGMVLQINGQQINDKALGWGATPFASGSNVPGCLTEGMSGTAWLWVKMDTSNCTTPAAFTLTAGTNTIGVAPGGWNSLEFAEVDLAPAKSTGKDTIKCIGANAVSTNATPSAIGITWVASGFKYVALGSAGKDTITFKAPLSATYKLRIFGQNVTKAAVPITITEGSTTLATANLPIKYIIGSTTIQDSTGNDIVSPTFTLAAGVHKLVLSGANVNIDYVQLIKQDIQTGVSRDGLVPGVFALEQNYPNPFNPTTTINFSLAKSSNVKLMIYNILGQQIRTLVDTRMNAGQQSVTFDASKFASGVYFYRLEAGDFSAVKKMLLLK
jgi:hypothetical protein